MPISPTADTQSLVQTEHEDNLDELDSTLDASASVATTAANRAVADFPDADEIAYGEPGNQYREQGAEQSNFYAGGTAPESVNYYPAGNPSAGSDQEGWAKETGGVRPHHEDAILTETGMHITENP